MHDRLNIPPKGDLTGYKACNRASYPMATTAATAHASVASYSDRYRPVKSTVSHHLRIIQIPERQSSRAPQDDSTFSQSRFIKSQNTESLIGTTVPRQLSYQLPKSYVCCLDIHFLYLSYLLSCFKFLFWIHVTWGLLW